MSEPQKKIKPWVSVLVTFACVGILFMLAVPFFIKGEKNTPIWKANACINHLRQIDAAINEWALEKGKTNGTVVTENDIKPYIKFDAPEKVLKCPQGGKYIYGKVGDNPQISCSLSTAVPPHKLP